MSRPPLVSLAGLVVIGAGLVLDLLVHLALPPSGHQHGLGFSPSEHSAHLVVMLGMALTLAGVVIDGARLQLRRRRSPAPSERSHTNAHR
jgi:hypothetical protein